ncbi:peptidase S8/S53 domain-containing protein [Trichoderma pleuroticola]
MVARLLLKVAPKAELYIAKVSDQEKMPKNQLHRIAEAIKWAVLEWDVDIISMSLALSEEHYDINEELTQALSPSSPNAKGKLVFAAAGNQGPYRPRAWPASKKGVIAVHATDGSGEGTKFNPNPESELNLSTLGENIKMRWSDPVNPGQRKNVHISGSSFSTPIAAGIAANVLEFARHRLELNEWKKGLLYSHHGMTKIMKAMSRRRGGYDFVHPLAFWEEAVQGSAWELPRNDPQNICQVLNSIIS